MVASIEEIVVVSGLPRSGTSLMMQILAQGGMEVVTDGTRMADEDNPNGYYELEDVKRLKVDSSWISKLHGKAIKVISQLLSSLPPNEQYRIIFMERDLEEVLNSQEKMMARRGTKNAPRDKVELAFKTHLRSVESWLENREDIYLLKVDFSELIARPQEHSERVAEFLQGTLDSTVLNIDKMVSAVEPSLYRNRR